MATLPTPPGELTPEQMFLGHLKLIEAVIAHGCRRAHFSPQDAEDFGGHVKLKLIEDDYAVFREYEGKASMSTYLTVVINRLLLDYQNHLWGKWRSSAEAERLGPAAILLERLLYREEYTFEQALQMMRFNYKVKMSEAQLRDLAEKLPPRTIRRIVSDDDLELEPSETSGPDENLAERERNKTRRRVYLTLMGCLQALPKEDHVLIKDRMRFSVAQISRLYGVEQKPLYRRLKKIYGGLRVCLKRHGVRRQDLVEVLESLSPEISDF